MTAPEDDTDFPLPNSGRGDAAGSSEDDPTEDDPFADAPAEGNPFDLGEGLSPSAPAPSPFGEPASTSETGTYSLGETTIPPKWGAGQTPPPVEALPDRPRRSAGAVVPAAASDDDLEEGDPVAAVPPPRSRSSQTTETQAGPAKPRLRDWLRARCKREAQMYALGAAVLAPIGLGAVGLTWLVLYFLASYYGTLIGALVATAIVALLFWVNRQAADERTIRVQVEPGDRAVKPMTIAVPRGSGLTWLMYLTGSRDLPGILQFLGAITLFGPRLCDLCVQMARTAQMLWTTDVDSIADPLKTLIRAEGKVAFAAFFERHAKLSPQGLVRRLGRIDGVLFLPTSTPPGLCVSNALKDEFAAWRAAWKAGRVAASDERLYD